MAGAESAAFRKLICLTMDKRLCNPYPAPQKCNSYSKGSYLYLGEEKRICRAQNLFTLRCTKLNPAQVYGCTRIIRDHRSV